MSQTFEGSIYGPGTPTRGCLTPDAQPGPLTIAGGVVRFSGFSASGSTAEGSVNAQGVLTMHGPLGSRFDGQIDEHGTVTGRLTGYYCSFEVVWQKEGN